jgi:hypothetical protein
MRVVRQGTDGGATRSVRRLAKHRVPGFEVSALVQKMLERSWLVRVYREVKGRCRRCWNAAGWFECTPLVSGIDSLRQRQRVVGIRAVRGLRLAYGCAGGCPGMMRCGESANLCTVAHARAALRGHTPCMSARAMM